MTPFKVVVTVTGHGSGECSVEVMTPPEWQQGEASFEQRCRVADALFAARSMFADSGLQKELTKQ